MNYSNLQKSDPDIYTSLEKELTRQQDGLELIPSENYVSEAVLEALGSVSTNKYSEGYPGKRYYGGNEFIDEIEQLAIDRAKQIFGAEHANVQPLSGAPANLAVYAALLKPGETVLGMDLTHGGHLTHGHPITFPAKIFNFVYYKTDHLSGLIDYDNIRGMAQEHKPKIILAGYSAYSRLIDWKQIQDIANEVNALTMADIAHIAGLIAGGVMDSPVPYFDVITTTTHKTLRGPRGAMILCKKQHAKAIDKSVFPGLQGGPHENNITAKAVAFKEVLSPGFSEYTEHILKNAKALEVSLKKHDFKICFGQTDNHLLLLDLTNKKVSGKTAQEALDASGITLNMNIVPEDPRSPMDPSGIRLGTPALTTRGMKEPEMTQVGEWINNVISDPENTTLQKKVKQEIKDFTAQFPLYLKI